MANFITINMQDLSGVLGDLNQLGIAGRNAYRRAVAKATKYAETQVVKQLAEANQIPQRAIRPKTGQRGKKRVFSSGTRVRDREPGYIWVGHDPLPVSAIEAPKKTADGTRVGNYTFPGSFIARMSSGFVSSFRRKANAYSRPASNVWGITTLPIEEDTIELDEAPAIVRNVRLLTQVRLRTLMQQELNYELNVKGYRPGRRR